MATLQYLLPEYDNTQRHSSLVSLYGDYAEQKQFYLNRRRETQELVDLLSERVDAELSYALKLDKISEAKAGKSFTLGTLAEEVENFRSSCKARSSQAAEVSENVHQDCIEPLKALLKKQDAIFGKLDQECQLMIDRLLQIDYEVKRTAMAYFKAGKNAEEAVSKYQRVKYDADLTYINRKQIYDTMMECLMTLKSCELEYKTTVDASNNYV